MRRRRLLEWVLLAAAAVSLGLGVAWLEDFFAIPKIVVQVLWVLLFVVVLGFAVWAAWGYYRAIRNEDEWD
jgi:ammonia channel protein AmtB